MKIVDTAIAAILLIDFATPVTSLSQEWDWPCAPDMGSALSRLEKEAHQFVLASAANERGTFTVFTVSPENATWSMLLLMPNGQVCMTHSGRHWTFVPPPNPGEPS